GAIRGNLPISAPLKCRLSVNRQENLNRPRRRSGPGRVPGRDRSAYSHARARHPWDDSRGTMLAQNFKTADELGLSQVEVTALAPVRGMLERGEIAQGQFHMGQFRHSCRTPSCICGWAHHISGRKAFAELCSPYGSMILYRRANKPLIDLFRLTAARGSGGDITPAQAPLAPRKYLSHREARRAGGAAASPPLGVRRSPRADPAPAPAAV